jgi:hypothetical protein
MFAALARPAAAQDSPLVQRGVPAEATAENAVVAKDRALLSAQRIAYERMAAALGIPGSASDAQIDGLVQSLVIESERVTRNSYAGRITVNFNPARVQGATASQPAAPTRTNATAVAQLDAVVRYGSLREWAEINRRLANAPPVARVEVLSVTGQMARLRLGLRSEPTTAALELAPAGLMLGPAPIGANPPEGWRLSLAGSR